MRHISRRLLVFGIYFALAIETSPASSGVAASVRRMRNQRRRLGEELLKAAEERDWVKVGVLLDTGADPNVTSFTPDRPLNPVMDRRLRYSLERPGALSQASSQGNIEAVKLLLQHGAYVNLHSVRDPTSLLSAVAAGQTEIVLLLLASGADVTAKDAALSDLRDILHFCRFPSHGLFRVVEDALKLPASRRSVPLVPLAPGAETVHPAVLRGTIGAVPQRHILWLSPHEILLLRDENSVRRFVQFNLKTSRETDLPLLSQKWLKQEAFYPDMFAVSPDGKWLVGYAGTLTDPTWLATEIHGKGHQEWPRIIQSGVSYSLDGVMHSTMLYRAGLPS